MIPKPSFPLLRINYSIDPFGIHRCGMTFPNTCAIRMSEALVASDKRFLQAFKNSNKNTCQHGFIRGAQDLASVLSLPSVLGPRNLGWTAQKGGEAPANVIGKTGIVCYMNLPGYSGQGHIDLWDRSEAVGSAYWDAQTIWMWTLL